MLICSTSEHWKVTRYDHIIIILLPVSFVLFVYMEISTELAPSLFVHLYSPEQLIPLYSSTARSSTMLVFRKLNTTHFQSWFPLPVMLRTVAFVFSHHEYA